MGKREVFRQLKIEGDKFSELLPVLLANVNTTIRVEASKARMQKFISDGNTIDAIQAYAEVREAQNTDITTRQLIWKKIAELHPEANLPMNYDGRGFKDKVNHVIVEWSETVNESEPNSPDDEPSWSEDDVVSEVEAPARL